MTRPNAHITGLCPLILNAFRSHALVAKERLVLPVDLTPEI